MAHAIAASVARRLLWGPWREAPNPYGNERAAYVCRDDGAAFFVELDRGRLGVRGEYPRGVNGYYFAPSGDAAPHVTVSAARPTEQIAAEIGRRFLPSYFAVLETVRKDVADHFRAHAAAEAVARRIARAAGAEAGHVFQRNREEWSVLVEDGIIRVRPSFRNEAPTIVFDLHGVPIQAELAMALALTPRR